jgi:hypothetical protein
MCKSISFYTFWPQLFAGANTNCRYAANSSHRMVAGDMLVLWIVL